MVVETEGERGKMMSQMIDWMNQMMSDWMSHFLTDWRVGWNLQFHWAKHTKSYEMTLESGPNQIVFEWKIG